MKNHITYKKLVIMILSAIIILISLIIVLVVGVLLPLRGAGLIMA